MLLINCRHGNYLKNSGCLQFETVNVCSFFNGLINYVDFVCHRMATNKRESLRVVSTVFCLSC